MKRLIIITGILILSLESMLGQEEQAKALYIYNFSRLIKWPEEYSEGNFTIGIYGDDAIYNYLVDFTKNKKVGQQNIKIIKFNTPSEVTTMCHILYISNNKSSKIREILTTIGNKPTLIISEKDNMISSGSIIDFVIVENKLKYKVSEQNASKRNLTLSKTVIDMSI